VGYGALLYRRRNFLTVAEEVLGDDLARHVDEIDDEVEECSSRPVADEPRRITFGKRKTFIAACVLEAKVQFGLPTDCEANRLMIRKFVRDMMVERGMRPTHIAGFLDLVVELVFVPSEDQILARRLRASVAWATRRERYAEPLQTMWWRRVTHYFGTRRHGDAW